MKVGYCTDTGQIRAINEDAVLVDEPLGLYAVADGMGGHDAGEVASRLAVNALQQVVADKAKEAGTVASIKDAPGVLLTAFREANERVLRLAEERSSDMATTLTAGLVMNGRLVMGHIGDSRAYRIHNNQIDQLTDDHSLVAELVRRGTLTQEQADHHPQRNVVLKAVGIDMEHFIPDIRTVLLEEDDSVLLCSDGLTNVLYDEEIVDLASKKDQPTAIATSLVDLVNSRGAPDNVTVLILQGPWGNAKRRKRVAAGGLKALMTLAVPLLAAAALVAVPRNLYYLGVAGQRIAIYRGIPGAPAIMAPRSPVEVTSVPISECLPPYRERLQRGIPVRDLQDASIRIGRMQVKKQSVGRSTRPHSPAIPSATHKPPVTVAKRAR